MPTISVVIPNYNRAALIGETLANVLAQSRPPDEVIVVDDGSTDGSVEAISRFGERVRLIRQANSGPGPARNRGLAAATGELIQFMDSDDLWSLNKLEAQARALEESGADFAYSPWLQARLEQGRAIHIDPVLQQRPLPPSRSPLAWFVRGWVTVFQCCLFRRDLLDRVGPYRKDLMPTEDSELLFRILSSGARPVHVPEALVVYRLHGGYQISQGGMASQRRALDWFNYVRIVADQLADTPGLTPADRRHWRWCEREAARGLVAAGVELAAGTEPGEPSASEQAYRRASLLAGRIGRRLRGNGFAAPVQAGPVTAGQRDLLREIGYEATQVPRAEFRQQPVSESS